MFGKRIVPRQRTNAIPNSSEASSSIEPLSIDCASDREVSSIPSQARKHAIDTDLRERIILPRHSAHLNPSAE